MQLLELFRKMLQHCFAVTFQKSLVDYKTFFLHPTVPQHESELTMTEFFNFGWTFPLTHLFLFVDEQISWIQSQTKKIPY